MTGTVLAIDHLMIHVPDSQDAGDAFEKLGFTVTPKSDLPGLSNRLICFGDTPHARGVCNYLELMALEDAEKAPPLMPQLLVPHGPVSTVLSVDDAHAVAARLSGMGFRVGPVLDLQRDWVLPDGSVITPAFAVTIPELGQAPIYWNFCLHKTAQHYVREEFVSHSNGALAFDELTAVVSDVEAAAEHYVEHWQAVRSGPTLALPEGPALHLIDAEEARRRFPGDLIAEGLGVRAIRVRVRDLVAARKTVEAGGVSTVDQDGGFIVRASDAGGCALIFAEQE